MPDPVPDYLPPSKPWIERDGEVRLLGMRCSYCLTAAFPAGSVCSACGQDDGIGTCELASRGTVYSFTELNALAPGIESPCVLACVDLDDGVRIVGQIDASPQPLAIGTRVAVVLGRVRIVPGGKSIVGYRFRRIGP